MHDETKLAYHILQFKNMEYDFIKCKTAFYQKIFKNYPFFLRVSRLLETEMDTIFTCPKHKIPINDCNCNLNIFLKSLMTKANVNSAVDIIENKKKEKDTVNYSKLFEAEKKKLLKRKREANGSDTEMCQKFNFLSNLSMTEPEKVKSAAGTHLYKKLVQHGRGSSKHKRVQKKGEM